MKKKDDTKIKISVRSLVEFILREGDIEGGQGAFKEKEAMQAGSRIHKKIQGRMGLEYTPEYSLKETFDCGNFEIHLEGRADGIWIQEDMVTVDEIKGIYRDLEYLDAPYPIHLAQAKVYAYLYAKQHGHGEINVRMTYVNLDTEEIKYFYEEYTFPQLEQWFLPIIEEYKKWARFQYEWRRIRQASIHETSFPFAYRKGQKELVAAVYRTIYHNKKLFIQAPTGVGKTLSTVFPAVKAVGEGLADKIFYLTAKTVTRTVAKEAFRQLEKEGLAYKYITLTAKEKLCVCEEPICDPKHCQRAKGHYDRVNDGVFAIINEQNHISREVLESYADKYQVCPFEFSLDISLWCDGIVCDYNYVFDPRVRLKRFFGESTFGEYIFLVDEAHNLVDRGRGMFSARLCKEDFLEIKRMVKGVRPKLEHSLESANKLLLSMKRECEECEVIDGIDGFILQLMNVAAELEKFLEDLSKDRSKDWPLDMEKGTEREEMQKQILNFYFDVRTFLNIYDRLDENYVIYTELSPENNFYLKLFCVNPGKNLSEVLDKGVGSILFSATLLPMFYYQSLLSVKDDDYGIYAQSPFPMENKKVLVASDVSSKYTRRTKKEYEKIAVYIEKVCKSKKGNYLVFFPSYKFMEDVYAVIQEQKGEDITQGIKFGCEHKETSSYTTKEQVEYIVQSSQMNETEREEFLRAFSKKRENSLIGLCVIGGIFGEGIDLKGEQLIGAIIVGTGLAQIDHEGELLREYYQKQLEDGFSYAYRYPGMNKVLQAAGRVIRTMDDKGIILLLDERFLQREYTGLFPKEWEQYERCRLENVLEKVAGFWDL